MVIPNGLAVISRVRCPHNSMRMVLGWLLVCQKDSRMMVEFHQDNRALDPEVERVIIVEATNPAKVCLVKMLLDLLELELTGVGWMVKKKLMTNGQDKVLFGGVERRD